MLALHYLPKAKFCMYLEEETLQGPFLRTLWETLGREIFARPTILDEDYVRYLMYRARESLPS